MPNDATFMIKLAIFTLVIAKICIFFNVEIYFWDKFSRGKNNEAN